MHGKFRPIATSVALLLYSVGAGHAHTLNVLPTGESLGAATAQTPLAATITAPPAAAAPQPVAAIPRKSDAPRANGSRRSHGAKVTFAKSGGSKRTRAGRGPAARKRGAASFAGVEARRRHLATEYYNHVGRHLVITSGYRTPARQARAIYNNLERHGVAYVIRTYKNKAAIREIVAAYKPRRARPRRAIAAMTKVIVSQTQNGVFVSRHLLGRAFDVRARGRKGAKLAVLREVAQEMGGRVLVENSHFHVEL